MAKHLTLGRYLLATAIATLILLGIEGGVAWATSAVVAWVLSRQPPAELRRYTAPFIIWCILVVLMLAVRAAR
jgi:hypothetical protein